MNHKISLLFLIVALGALFPWSTNAESAQGKGENPMIEVVDIPTADILDLKTYDTTFRFYSGGGITSRLLIGPLTRVNLGISFDAQNVIGGQSPHLITPAVFFKVRIYDGSDVLPALAAGYDNQGMLYQQSTKQFLNREKGLYLVGSHEIFVPNFDLHMGINMYDFNSNSTPFGFVGATYKVTSAFAFLAEYDNIHNLRDSRVNLGGRYFVTPYFNIDLAARNVGRGAMRGAERIVRLNYVGNFPF